MSTRLPLAEYAEQFLNTEPVWANPMLGPEAGDVVNVRAEAGKLDTVMSDTRVEVLGGDDWVEVGKLDDAALEYVGDRIEGEPIRTNVSAELTWWAEPDEGGSSYIPLGASQSSRVRDEYNHPLTVGEMRARKAAREQARRAKGQLSRKGWAGYRARTLILDEATRIDERTLKAFARNPYFRDFAKAARNARLAGSMRDYRRRQLAASVPRRNYVADYHERRNNRVNVDGFNVHRWLAEALDLPWTELPLDIPERTATPW